MCRDDLCCGEMMKRIDDRIEKSANNDLQIHGVTLTQIQMLLALNQIENGSAALKEVEKYFGIAQSTTAGIAVRLERNMKAWSKGRPFGSQLFRQNNRKLLKCCF